MNRIEALLAELCPEGVEYKALEELGTTYGGLTGKNKADFSNGNARFVAYRNIFANLAVDLEANDFVRVESAESQNHLELGDVLFTGSSETPDEVGMSSVVVEKPVEAIYLNSFCFGYRFNDRSLLLPGFSKYLFRSADVRQQIVTSASGVTRFNVSKKRFLKTRIPVPPLEVQRAIVRVLDTFTALEAELEAELEARRRQYQHYRDALLTFQEKA
jgi:type I restriction enzyme S subunit